MLVNPAKRECLRHDKLGECAGKLHILQRRHVALALGRLIADPPLGGATIDGRWAGDPVVLAGGQGGDPQRLYDRATDENFADISALVLADLCDDGEVFAEFVAKAARAGEPFERGKALVLAPFFVHFCVALMQHRPALLNDPAFTRALGTDWRRRYEQVYREEPIG